MNNNFRKIISFVLLFVLLINSLSVLSFGTEVESSNSINDIIEEPIIEQGEQTKEFNNEVVEESVENEDNQNTTLNEDESNIVTESEENGIPIEEEIPENDYGIMPINAGRAETVTSSTKIPNEYSWSFKFISGKTTIETHGMTNYANDFKLKDRTLDSSSVCGVRLTSNSQKGNIWIKYKNVGTYNGEIIDLKIIVSGWSYLQPARTSGADSSIGGINYPCIFFAKDRIAVMPTTTPGIDSPIYTYEFYKHNTDTKISIKCHNTFRDMDGGEMLKPQSGFDVIYRSANSNITEFSSAIAHCPKAKGGCGNTDRENWTTCLISGSSFKFIYTREDDIKGNSYRDMTATASKTSRSQYEFNISSDALAHFDFSTPSKKVSKTEVFGEDEFYYTIQHFIPGESSEFYYTRYTIGDYLEPCLEVAGNITVEDDSETDRTNWFTITNSNNTIQIVANSSTLTNAEFYNNNFYFKIPVRKKAEYDMTRYYSESTGKCTVSNTASDHVERNSESSTRTTNTVEVDFYCKTTTDVENGNITNSNNKVPLGKNVKIEYSPFKGYVLKSVTVNGNPIDIEQFPNEYNIPGITGDYNVEVVYEIIYGTVKINKLGENNKKLEGVEFTLYAKEDIIIEEPSPVLPFSDPTSPSSPSISPCSSNTIANQKVIHKAGDVIEVKTTGPDGTLEFSNLYAGKYELIETKTLKDYNLQAKSIEFEVSEDNTSIEFTIKNKLKTILPKAGGYSIIFMILGLSFVIISSIVIFKINKKGTKNEKEI